MHLGALSADTTGELDVLGHDGNTLGVDGAKVGVLEQTYQVSLAGLLKSHDGGRLEAKVGLEVLGNLAYQTLEGKLADEKLGRLLVSTDLAKSYGSWPVTMRFLHASGGRCALASRLGGQLLPGSLASRRFASCLLRTCHVYSSIVCLRMMRATPSAPALTLTAKETHG